MKNKTINSEKILSDYGNYLLTHGERPKNIYVFFAQTTLMKKNFINSFQTSNINFKAFFFKNL